MHMHMRPICVRLNDATRIYPCTYLFIVTLRLHCQVDDLVAAVVRELDALGVLGNTYIVFSSDHGYKIGQAHTHTQSRTHTHAHTRTRTHTRTHTRTRARTDKGQVAALIRCRADHMGGAAHAAPLEYPGVRWSTPRVTLEYP